MADVIQLRRPQVPDADEAHFELREAINDLDNAQSIFAARGRHDIALRVAAHKHALKALLVMSGGVP